MKFIVCGIFFLLFSTAQSQTYIVKNIKSFGAKGDGKTNDHEAFKMASEFFNNRGGNGKLIIPKGIYIVGRQVFTGGQLNKPAYHGEDILHFTDIKNLSIEGAVGSKLKYINGLRIGAFSPETGKQHEHGNNLFVKRAYAAIIGNCILIQNSFNIRVSGVTLDGNSDHIILGGIYGDVGRQMPHYGIFISNSKNIQINKVSAHHFGLDGICVANKETNSPDSISISNSTFEYNSRQGLSWIGGNYLRVKNCKFNHTGKAKFSSPPGAGIDIEAEVGPVRNGTFEDCEFIDNTGCGVGADSGNSADCIFRDCTFWGTTNWSIWVTKPNFTFYKCNIYGSIVHGYSSLSIQDATKFYNCLFEDKLYNGKPAYGNFLVEINEIKRMVFSDCTFISNIKKLCWFFSSAGSAEEKYQITNCSFTINNTNLPVGDYAAIIRGASLKNCTFTFSDPELKKTLAGVPSMNGLELASNVSTKKEYTVGDERSEIRIAVLDFGIKRNILNCLLERGAYVKVFNAETSFSELENFEPHGYFISNGPGDPEPLHFAVKTIKEILHQKKPFFGICLGHQLLALANDIPTFKMHHGHRGLNHPVKNIRSGKCEITTQNHGFGVNAEAVRAAENIEITHINLNDDSIEGIRMKDRPAFSVQYHPESTPGPYDSRYLFDDFFGMMRVKS